MEIDHSVIDEIIALTSRTRGSRTINDYVSTYNERKMGVSCFYHKALFSLTVFK